MGVRKNCNALSAAEKKSFVDAVLALKANGRYDELVQIHLDALMSSTPIAHGLASFLPWHRQYLLGFEQDLQKIDPAVNLPYWDWTVDSGTTGAPWTDDLLGGTGQGDNLEVTTGPFAHATGNWTLTVQVADRPFLTRDLGASGTLPTAAQVAASLELTPYDVAPFDFTSTGGFRNENESQHNRVHVWVGGDMGTGSSPNDPAFWLHHCFVDKLWSDWQKAHPAEGYLPTTDTPGVIAANDPMAPFGNVTPAQLLDHQSHYTYA